MSTNEMSKDVPSSINKDGEYLPPYRHYLTLKRKHYRMSMFMPYVNSYVNSPDIYMYI